MSGDGKVPVTWKLKKSGGSIPSPAAANPSLVEVHEWVQPSHCHQHDNTLRPGHLLRWMDITACLSAEKHAKFPCVTVTVDDITFDSTVSVGHVVILSAVVNRAFSSSLEVEVTVQSEDPLTGKRQEVCNAYCVFVAKPKDGSKVKLLPVPLVTEKEHREHLLAAERRRMRITYTKDIDRLLKSLQVTEDSSKEDSPTSATITVSQTKVQTVHIVLPVHANHHDTTFGGQIMEWMTDLATISALRLCRCKLVLEGIESVHFRGPSYMGERLFVQTSVNRVFSNNRFEVGIRVEGYAVGEESRHINSAFYIFRATEENVTLPRLIADTEIEEGRAACAVARHCLWLDRKSIQIQEHSVALNSENIYNLILKNTSKLMTNFSLRDWETLSNSSREVELSKKSVDKNMFLKLVLTVQAMNAEDVYTKLSNYKARQKWDFLCKNVRVVRSVTDEDSLLHLAYNPMRQEELPKDFVLLASKRKPLAKQANDDQQFYMVAYSSVLFTELPPLRDYARSQVISSGYIIDDIPHPSHAKCCRITYLHQLGSSVMPFFSKDLLGVSSLMEKLCISMKKYLLTK